MDIKELEIYRGSSFKERHPWELARVSIVHILLRKILNQSGSCCRKVLDVGSGDAFVIQTLSKILPNLEFTGLDSAYTPAQMELFAQQPELCRCKFHQNMETLKDPQNLPDIALFLDVLEHVEDDAGLLAQAASLLKSGGFALITVPAFQSLFCTHDTWLGHYRRYNKKQVEKISRQAGLEIIEAGYFFSCLLLPRLFQKLSERLRSAEKTRNVGIGEWPHGKLLGNIIKTGLILNAKVDIWFGKHNLPNTGLSVYAICKKSA